MELLSPALHARLNDSARAETVSLAEETDLALAAEGWLAFAGREEQAGRLEIAADIYANAAAASGSEPWRDRARERLDTLLGGGSFGARFELLSQNFARQAADPAMLAGMGAAATVFSLVRLGALSRLLASPANLLTRGAGARLVSAGAGFVPEVGAFWGASRLTRATLYSEPQSWDGATVSREFATLGLGLGLLKFGGWASRGLFDRVHGIDAVTGSAARLSGLTRFSRPLAEQAGMFTGIGLAHYLEPQLGLRNAGPEGSFWSDSLATLLQFHVGGRLSRELLGPRHAAWMQGLALRTRTMESARPLSERVPLGEGLIFSQMVTPEGIPLPPATDRGPPRSRGTVSMMSHPVEVQVEGAEPEPKSEPRPTRLPTKGSSDINHRILMGRVSLERRIENFDPNYFTPERLGGLLSQLRKNFFDRSERARLQHAIRRYLNEKNLPHYPLDHPEVRASLAQPWVNPQNYTHFSERFQTTLREIEAAREVVRELTFRDGTFVEASPFRRSEGLSRELGTEFYFLNDAGRPTGSFKERGALIEVRRAALEGALHVVTASHGNHGLAVAMAAQKLGLRSTIVVPDTTPQIKVDRLRERGATVVTTGEEPWRGYEEARDWALRYTFERNLYLQRRLEVPGVMRYVHGFEDVIPGQGVAGFEILEAIQALPEPVRNSFARATFLLPTGGGGLSAGVGTVLRRHLPEARVIAVASEEAPALHFSLTDGRRSEVFLNEKGLCDSGIGLTIPGAKPFELLRQILHGSITVSDPLVGEAMRRIHHHEGLVVEGSAATGLAALLSGRLGAFGVSPEHPVVTIFTGGNIDPVRHEAVLAGREAAFPSNGVGKPISP